MLFTVMEFYTKEIISNMAKITIDGALVGFLKSQGENVFNDFVDNTAVSFDANGGDTQISNIDEGFFFAFTPQGAEYWRELLFKFRDAKKKDEIVATQHYVIDLKPIRT